MDNQGALSLTCEQVTVFPTCLVKIDLIPHTSTISFGRAVPYAPEMGLGR